MKKFTLLLVVGMLIASATVFAQNNATVYPNPIKSESAATVKWQSLITKVVLSGADGKPLGIWKDFMPANKVEITIPKVATGIYNLQIFSNKEKTTQRIVVSK